MCKRHLETSQKCLQDTAKETYEVVIKISKIQLLFKSNQCLSKALFRQLIHTSVNCLERTSGCLATNFRFVKFRFSFTKFLPFFLGFFIQIFAIFQSPDFCLHIRWSFCIIIFWYLMVNYILFTERQISGSP